MAQRVVANDRSSIGTNNNNEKRSDLLANDCVAGADDEIEISAVGKIGQVEELQSRQTYEYE